jgi:hypothetical protein
MKILFIAGSLNFGGDGVADYTQRLSFDLKKLGVESRLLGWNETQLSSTRTSADSLRLPSNLPLRAKLSHARHFLNSFQPDIISLQFVPYAFENRGLPFSLAREIQILAGNIPIHICAHELWIMPMMKSSLVSRIIGSTLQKNIVIKTFQDLSPRLIHTAVPLYAEALKKEGFSSIRNLPLHGNIPFVSVRNLRNTDEINVGFFGSIFPSTPLESFFEHLSSLNTELQAEGKTMTIFAAGNVPVAQCKRWNDLTKRFSGRLKLERLGHLNFREVSYYLQSLDLFLSGYSPLFWQKSGTIASAREHGLPIVLVSPAEAPTQEKLPEGFYTQVSAELIKNPPQVTPYIPATAEIFLKDLQSFSSK